MAKKKIENAKRVDIVSIKMVKDSSIKYANRQIGSPFEAFILVKDLLEGCDREKLLAICLDTKNQPTNISVVSVGSVNASIVHPREVFKTAILSNSSKIMLAHNHPSQILKPSSEDKLITKRIQDSGEILGIELLDHIILGDNEYFSFKENCIL